MTERTISETKNIGLRGIPVADTKISAIDGERGVLIYRGFNVLELVRHSTFEEVAYLLLFGDLPNRDQLESFQQSLARERIISAVTCTGTGDPRSPFAINGGSPQNGTSHGCASILCSHACGL
jgi:citrate synthase